MYKQVKTIFFAIALVYSLSVFSQEKQEFGKVTEFERNFTVYEKDTTASAIYLYEYGDNYFEVRDRYIWLITKYHAKIKILNKKGFDQADVEIPLYHSKDRKDKIKNLSARTHNDGVVTGVKKEEVFEVKLSDRWSEKRFAFSNVKVGSILEYAYEMQSPFYFNFTGWGFQSEIPKIYSEFNAKIPGNWVYNRTLIGALKLAVNEASIKKYCFDFPGAKEPGACEVLKYVMKDVPAFKEAEDYMLSSRNYRAKLEFELAEYKNFHGGSEKYTKSWEDVDKEFRLDKDIGSQLRKKNFFEKSVDQALLTTGDDLTRAKGIYKFVQNHFVWNEEYGIWHDNRVKNAFDEKKGNVAEINITLINLLNAAGLKSEMMLMATRNKGLPKKTHPVMSDFNYIVAKVDINGQSYLLDATDKNFPFGMLPYRCLNYYGRVMDFDKESYWFDIVPERVNKKNVRVQMIIDPLSEKLSGIFSRIHTGYFGVSKKKIIDAIDEEEYIAQLEDEMPGDFRVTSYDLQEEYSNEKKLVEKVEFEVDSKIQNGFIYVNPFIFKFFKKNPFLAEERSYPIDFGYLRNYKYTLALNVPEGYKLKSMPEPTRAVLPNNLGFLKFKTEQNSSGVISLFFELDLRSSFYNNQIYKEVKQLFSEAVSAQNQSFIVLEKIE